MTRTDETKFVLHGLDADNAAVRADVFVQKLRTLLGALHESDKFANGKARFEYIISDLERGSAAVTLREKQRTRKRPLGSGVRVFETVTSAVYNGVRPPESYPPALVRTVEKLAKGASRTFSHGEIAFADTVIRIDDFFERQSEEALMALNVEPARDRFFHGLSTVTLDGFLREIDSRGTMLRGKIVLTAGGSEIDCVMNKERVPEARDSFDKRVIVEGLAHYDGREQLPVRVDVKAIRTAREDRGLERWRGAFVAERAGEEDDEW